MNIPDLRDHRTQAIIWQGISIILFAMLVWVVVDKMRSVALPDPQGMLVEIARPDNSIHVMDSGRARVTFEFEKRDADYVLSLDRSRAYRVQITSEK